MAAPKPTRRDDKAVKIARDLAVKAKLISESKGMTIAEYLSGLLRPHIDKDWPKALGALDRHTSDPDA